MTKLFPNVESNITKLTKLSEIVYLATFSFKDFSDPNVSKGALDLYKTGIGGEMIVSSKLMLCDGKVDPLSVSNLIKNLSSHVIKYDKVIVIEVSLDLDSYYGNSEVVTDLNKILKPVCDITGQTYNHTDIQGKAFEFYYIKCHLYYFINHTKDILKLVRKTLNEKIDLNSDINFSPIIIFKCGLTWSNIISLIQLNNITVHGGSISRRHKVSITEYRLSTFLYLSGLTGSKNHFYDSYVDKFFSSTNLVSDLSAYKYINKHLSGYRPSNGVLLNYYLLNKQIKTLIDLAQINKSILSLEESLKGLNNFIHTKYEQELSSLDQLKSQNLKKLSEVRSKDLSFSSSKHKNVVHHKIKILKSNISTINQQILSLSQNLSENNTTKTDTLQKLSESKNKFISLQEKLSAISLESESVSHISGDKSISLLPINSFLTRPLLTTSLAKGNTTEGSSSKSSPRKYHSLILKRDFTSSSTTHKLNFEVNSPGFTELVRFLNNSPVTEETQIQLETYLLNQGEQLYKSKLEEVLDINYFKLNPLVLNILKNSLSDLDKLITNYKNNVENSNQYGKEIHLVLSGLDNKLIISNLLGRVLKIISNHKQVNKNTISINVAIDLAKDLINYFISNEFTKFNLQMSKTKETEINQSKNKYTLSKFISEHTEFDILYTDVLLFTLGINLLNFLEEIKLIKTTVVQLETNAKQTIFTADKKFEVLLSNYHLLDVPYKLPMIVPPAPPPS